MATFILGLVILFVGAAIYGKFCEKVFGPDDRETPAYSKQDGVDYVPMRGWKNSLINLLNIAGTGPIFGPIQGILFGPIAFITIPIGNVIGGAMHDYFSGMICLRDGGSQMSSMIRKYSNKGVYRVYNVFVCLLLLLVGAVFIYTPGDIAATGIFNFSGLANDPTTWIIYGAIFVYYLIATVFPIDAIIGRIYPVFGAILMFSALGVFIGLFAHGYPLLNIWDDWQGVAFSAFQTTADGGTAPFSYGEYFATGHFLPVFRGISLTRARPALWRTTTRSETLTRLDRWVAIWRMWSYFPWATWSSSRSMPTDLMIQGVAVFRLSRNTSLTMSCW